MKDRTIKYVFVFLSLLLLTSILYSKFLLSVSMFGLGGLAILYSRKQFSVRFNSAFWSVILIFLLTVLSGINSENISDWMHHVRMKLPFLVFPLIFFNLPRLDRNTYFGLHYFFAILVILSAIPGIVYYLTHFDEVQKALGKGQAIATPVHHVKFSFFLAFSILIIFIFRVKKWIFKYDWEKWLQWCLIGTGIVFLHVLAIRTGIVVFYLTALLLALYAGKKSGKWKWPLSAVLLLITLPYLAYLLIPSLHKRVHYMIWDYKQYVQNIGDNYSDSDRLQSLEIGWEIFCENPIAGVGIGDLKNACTEKYNVKYGPDKYVLYPHNQYLFILASTGMVGFILFLIAYLFPYFRGGPQNELLLLLGVMMVITFMIDNVLERSFSIGFYVFFVCLGIKYGSRLYKTDGK